MGYEWGRAGHGGLDLGLSASTISVSPSIFLFSVLSFYSILTLKK